MCGAILESVAVSLDEVCGSAFSDGFTSARELVFDVRRLMVCSREGSASDLEGGPPA